MKKVLLGSLVLTMFSVAVVLFQLSCKKTADAQSSTGATQLNLILLSRGVQVNSPGPLDSLGRQTTITKYVSELDIMNIDGSNLRKVPIALPAGLSFSGNARLSPDGKTIIFSTSDMSVQPSIYSCNIDGSNSKKLIDGPWSLLDVR